MDRSSSTAAMARRWEELARANPMHFIATAERDWNPDDFHASGRAFVQLVLDWIGLDHPRDQLLEIGCGLCRTSMHFAEAFEHVHGVDISPSMIEQARKQTLPDNLHVDVCTGATLDQFDDATFDCVYSALVFQHIADLNIIRSYLRETARTLRPGGSAVFQFDSRPQSAIHRLYKSLPDAVLPSQHRRFIRRYRRDPAVLCQWIEQAGLTISDQHGRGTEAHWFRLRKDGATS